MIARAKFFAAARKAPFGGSMKQDQVDGCLRLLEEMEARGWRDRRWLAYVLATAYHETAATMQPIAEYGKGKGKAYGKPDPVTKQTYYGRGYVQLTWKDNYARMGERLGQPLVAEPDLAMDPEIAAGTICEGMKDGMFTGKALRLYFNTVTDDPVNARRIVNGTDRAEMIAGYHRSFLAAVTAGWEAAPVPVPNDPMVAWLAEGAALTRELEAWRARCPR